MSHCVLMTCPPSETSSVVTLTPCHTRASSTSGKQSSTEVSRLNLTLVFGQTLFTFILILTFFCRISPKTPSVNPCELHCRPLNEHFSEKMQDAVTDGTPCYEGNKSRDMCINGICKVSVLYLLFHIFSHK